MTSDHERVPFPQVDLQRILVRWSDCLSVVLGRIDPDLVDEMRRRDFDYAPVLRSAGPDGGVLGLISRERLEELASEGREVTEGNKGIHLARQFFEVWVRSSLDELLRQMAERPAWIVEDHHAGEYGEHHMIYGMVTRSDLNKHPIRVIVYEVLAKLEMELARCVSESFADHWEWIGRLNEDSQARILGYWELAKRKEVDTGPVAGATLSELLRAVSVSKELLRKLGYSSRKTFDKETSRIPGVRNEVMHPVRPLITDAESCLRLEAVLREAIRLAERARAVLEAGKP